jgi:hypothetical protein
MLTIFQVKVKKFNQAWVNGGSNYGSIKMGGYGESQMPVSCRRGPGRSQHNQIAGTPKAFIPKRCAKANRGQNNVYHYIRVEKHGRNLGNKDMRTAIFGARYGWLPGLMSVHL